MATARKPLLAAVLLVCLIGCADASAALRVQWTRGMAVPGSPARYDRIGVLKIGPAPARNVLVLVPGTSAGSAYFVPLAQWIVSRARGLTDDLGAIGSGTASPAQRVLGLHATLGRHLPRRLRIYAFGAALGGSVILDEARQLAVQSHIPLGQVTLINRHRTYAHNDPNGAYPHNVFFAHLIPFLTRVASGRG